MALFYSFFFFLAGEGKGGSISLSAKEERCEERK